MSDDGSYEGEYPGQEGLPFDEGGEDRRRAGDDAGLHAGGRGPSGGSDDDLFVWNELRPPSRDDRRRRPADAGLGDRRAPESPAGAGGARESRRERRASGDWRAPEYPTGAGRTRHEPADGYEASDEWEEWLEPEAPHGLETIGPLPERHKGARRRRLTAGAVLLAMLLGFLLAGLLDAGNIRKDVEARPYGALRTVQLALLAPMTALSGAVHADRLGAAVADALGRGEQPHHTLAEVKKAKPLWPRKITAKKPLRLYVAGDSMDQVFGSSLVNLGDATGLVKGKNDYHVSSGLSRPDFYDWPQRLVDQIVDFRPDAAAVLFGANDGQDVMFEGKVLKVGTKAWQGVYAQRVGEAMDVLSKGGRRVYWVGNPIMRDFDYRQHIAMMNHIYQAEAAKRPGVAFVSTWATMANAKGSYAEYLPDANGDQVLMRAPDGIHLTRAGGDRMAQRVLDVIMQDWGMAGSASPSPAP